MTPHVVEVGAGQIAVVGVEERLQVHLHGRCLTVGEVVEMPSVVFAEVAGAREEEDAAALLPITGRRWAIKSLDG